MSVLKKKWMIICLIGLALFLVLSAYRYKQVNAPFKDYKVLDITESIGESFTNEGFSFTFWPPTSEDKGDYIYYEVPILLKNNTDSKRPFPFERIFLRSNEVNNGVNVMMFRTHAQNAELESEYFSPGQEEELILPFTMYKMYGASLSSKTNLYVIGAEDNGRTMVKHKLPIR